MTDRQNDPIFSITDLFKLFSTRKRRIFAFSFLVAFLFFALSLFRPVEYKVKALFKEAQNKKENGSLIKYLDSLSITSSQSEASIVMRSRFLWKELIEKLGLQVLVKERSFFTRVKDRICDSIRAELKKNLKDLDQFEFKDVVYTGERRSKYFLCFTDRDTFDVICRGQVLSSGSIKERLFLGDISFILTKTPKFLKIRKNYEVIFLPWQVVAKDILRKLVIVPQKKSKNVLSLELKDRKRHRAAEILNFLMAQYQNYLKEENEKLGKEQLSYLTKRYDELQGRLDESLNEYVHYLSATLGERGFVDLDWEMENLMAPQREYQKKILEIDLETRALERAKEKKFLPSDASVSGRELKAISKALDELKQERDVLDIALSFNLKREQENEDKERLIEKRIEELERIAQSKIEAQRILKSMKGGLLSLEQEITNIPKLIQWWQERGKTRGREEFEKYLKNYIHLLSLQERFLQERRIAKIPEEFESINLDMARAFFMDYNRGLDELQLSINKQLYARGQLENCPGELASLSSILLDSVSQDLITQATALSLKLEDERNCSLKEKERIKEELRVQRKFLLEHVGKMIDLKKVQAHILQDKICFLKQVMLDRINQKISLLEQRARNYVISQIENLGDEKELVVDRIKDLNFQMKDFPQRWQLEKSLNFKTQLSMKIMKTMTQLIESKTVAYNLSRIESKPIDLAIAPLRAKNPHLFLFSLIVAIIGVACAFAYYFFKAAVFGFPISLEILSSANFHVCGSLSFFLPLGVENCGDSDLETLRKISTFIGRGKVIGLIGNGGPNYSHILATLFAKRKRKVLLIEIDFQTKVSQQERGFVQFIEDDICLPLSKREGYDFLSTGKTTRFGNEILDSISFFKMIDNLKESYDLILVYYSSSFLREEARIFIRFSDKMVITFKDETMEMLQPYIKWDDNNDRLSFITISRD